MRTTTWATPPNWSSEHYHVSREEQDAYSLESHRRALAAMKEGRFDAEIVAVEVPGRKGETVTVATRRRAARRYHHRGAAPAQAGLQEGRHRHRRQRPRRQRRRRRVRGDLGPQGRRTGLAAAVPHLCPGHQRPRTQVGDDGPGRGDAHALEEDRVDARRRRPLRDQRGLRGAGGGRGERAWTRASIASTSTAARWRWAIPSAPAARASW